MTYAQLISCPAGISLKAADALDRNLHSTVLAKGTPYRYFEYHLPQPRSRSRTIPVATLSAIPKPSEGGIVVSPPSLRSEMSRTRSHGEACINFNKLIMVSLLSTANPSSCTTSLYLKISCHAPHIILTAYPKAKTKRKPP